MLGRLTSLQWVVSVRQHWKSLLHQDDMLHALFEDSLSSMTSKPKHSFNHCSCKWTMEFFFYLKAIKTFLLLSACQWEPVSKLQTHRLQDSRQIPHISEAWVKSQRQLESEDREEVTWCEYEVNFNAWNEQSFTFGDETFGVEKKRPCRQGQA